MWTLVAFLIAAILGVPIVLGFSRRTAQQPGEYPWLLDEVSKLHVAIVGGLAGFAFTGVVLVVTIVRDTANRAELDTVILMFLVAFLYWVGAAFLISYVPHAALSGDFVQRAHFSLATTIEYRTVFLSWFALVPLLQVNGFGRLIPILYFLLPASLLLGSLLLAMATDGLGLLRIRETYVSAAVASTLTLAYYAIVAWFVPAARSPYSAQYLTLVIFAVNGLGFGFAALTSLAPRYERVRHFYERYGRSLVVTDMQLTILSLVFLWLAVVNAV
ncbi:MAG TPA: hypothetical protein VGZ02_05190 [Candidatus Baltobacteraceae bacterium]|jgi:hypothetical protein|nr:hypothetical protein [Candidatus Baltobacteraceae bacterium]